ncbi:MAG: PA14 domain-containing protein [Verrucomicrobiae bacterium]|nr:PA14 domain-containing protein [Verrucomicrobiae bacterium]
MPVKFTRVVRFFLVAVLFWPALSAVAGVNVLTYHYDNARTGQNTNETVLSPANVASTNFGRIFSQTVDGYVYAQPLVVTNLNLPGKGVRDVVFVATEHDSVYAFDANSNVPALWWVSFTNPAAGITTVDSQNDIGCDDLVPEVGITSTPVIDLATGTIYVSAKTKQVTNSVTTFHHQLHALSLTNGAEKFGGPVELAATVAGTGDGNDGAGHVPFDPFKQFNRSALLLNAGVVYIGSAAHCDYGPYHGWLLGYAAQTLTLSNVFNTTPNGGLGGIWQSGCGPSSDAGNNLYFLTGNGTFDAETNGDYGDSFVKLSTTNGLKVADYFTPYDQAALNSSDLDLGSGGAVVLPDEVGGGTTNQHLLVGAGKEGTVYLINREYMRHYGANDSAIVQAFPGAITGGFDTPAYFNKTLYYIGINDVLKAFTLTNAHIGTTPASQNANSFGFPGATPVVSANGTSNAIVWALQTDAYAGSGPSVLHAYNATNVAVELYNSSTLGARDQPGGAVKFAVPTVANGHVYVGAQYSLAVYGVGTFLAAPVITPAGAIFTNSISVTITDAVPGTTIFYTQDGSPPTSASSPYTGPLLLTNSTGLRALATKPGAADSIVTTATFLNTNSIGTGTGLTGAYYASQLRTFTNPPTLVRTDATVNFNWGAGSPDPAISADDFTVLWTGTVQPQFNETYTFYTTTDDGVRLWVNGQLVVDKWVDQSATQWGGSLPLVAGRKYPVTLEYYEVAGDASASLSWSSPSTTKTVIPQSQLYPGYPPAFLPVTGPITNGQFNLQVAGLIGKGYVLQASTNLAAWVSIQTSAPAADPNVTLPTNIFNFTDAAVTNFPHRFYRTLQQP